MPFSFSRVVSCNTQLQCGTSYKKNMYNDDFLPLENHLKLLMKFQILSYSEKVKRQTNMAKKFEFINNNSDVYVVGNSQLAGFKGFSKDKERAMNISWCRGAQIQDCLTECERRYRHKWNKVKL